MVRMSHRKSLANLSADSSTSAVEMASLKAQLAYEQSKAGHQKNPSDHSTHPKTAQNRPESWTNP